jgi:hypothetical protein
VAQDSVFLLTQLRREPIELLFLNGRAVLNAFRSVLHGDLKLVGEIADRAVRTKLHVGTIGEARVIGWSTNLQSSFGVTTELRNKLAVRIAALVGSAKPV